MRQWQIQGGDRAIAPSRSRKSFRFFAAKRVSTTSNGLEN
jgi:hypothetical protein